MKTNPTRYSSAVGEIWVMATFKVKYCHNLFDKLAIREFAGAMFAEALYYYGIRWKKVSFDSNHVHIILDMGLYKKEEIAKKLKGFTATKILKEFPWLKKWLLRGKGFWNRAYDMRTGDMNFYSRYLDGQKYASTNQVRLAAWT